MQVIWGYALFADRVGNLVPKPIAECHGAEIPRKLCGHLRFDPETVESANCIPCGMPYITSMFMPRVRGDRPLPVPRGSRNLAFINQLVEIADDVVFTVEYMGMNVGGESLEAALSALRVHGRIVARGSISGYNEGRPRPGPSNLFNIITKRLTIGTDPACGIVWAEKLLDTTGKRE